MIKEIAENAFRKEVRQTFDMKAVVEFAKDRGEANQLIFLATPGSMPGSTVIGSIGIVDLVAAIRSDSGSIELQTKNGTVLLDTCTAVMEIMEMYMNPATLETLRKEWRESFINKPEYHQKAGLPGYGGLVKKGQGGESKMSG